MEERFFFHYHMQMSEKDCMSLPVHERKWLIQRFVSQKRREAEEIDKARRAKKH